MDNEVKWIKHYSNRHEILLVGEGDFSFAASLATAFGDASNITATSLDSQVMLGRKHPTAAANLALLIQKGCTVIHDVDACTMSQHPLLTQKKFDRIVFNFPYTGFSSVLDNSYPLVVDPEMISGFFRSGCAMLREGGEIHLTHQFGYPHYDLFTGDLVRDLGLRLIGQADFKISDYPGYENKRGDGWSRKPTLPVEECLTCKSSNHTFPVGECWTFKFAKLSSTDRWAILDLHLRSRR